MNILSIGELLIRLSVPDHLRFKQAESFELNIGGSEANVAIALSQLGWKSKMISALPDNDMGERICQELNKFGVDINYIYRLGERIGLYFLEEGSAIRSSKIIYDRSNSSINELTPDLINWEEIFKDVTHLHWSAITPALSANAAAVCLEAVNRAHELGVLISCDLHFRKNLWSYGKSPSDIIPQLLEKSSTVLGDPNTIEVLTGIEMKSKSLASIERVDQIQPDYQKFMEKYKGIEQVSMLLRTVHNASHHSLKAVMVTKNGAFESSSIDVESITDRIGGGDAYMAGILFGLDHFDNKKEALEYALAMSALKHTIKGDYYIGTNQDVLEIMNSKQVGKIIR